MTEENKKITNRHGDHEASCLCCKRFSFEYDGGYSDTTPGFGLQMLCFMHHFTLDVNTGADYKKYHSLQERGATCVDFSGKET